MKELFLTSQFKKDFKRLKNNPLRANKIIDVLEKLQKGEPLGKELKAHELKGNYKNHMECHVENDVLLIWHNKEENTITAVRTGSHSELFGKKK